MMKWQTMEIADYEGLLLLGIMAKMFLGQRYPLVRASAHKLVPRIRTALPRDPCVKQKEHEKQGALQRKRTWTSGNSLLQYDPMQNRIARNQSFVDGNSGKTWDVSASGKRTHAKEKFVHNKIRYSVSIFLMRMANLKCSKRKVITV